MKNIWRHGNQKQDFISKYFNIYWGYKRLNNKHINTRLIFFTNEETKYFLCFSKKACLKLISGTLGVLFRAATLLNLLFMIIIMGIRWNINFFTGNERVIILRFFICYACMLVVCVMYPCIFMFFCANVSDKGKSFHSTN